MALLVSYTTSTSTTSARTEGISDGQTHQPIRASLGALTTTPILKSAARLRPASTISAAQARKRKVPHFDDLLFLGASMSRYPLEGYREACNTAVTLGDRFAKNPIELDIPITIAGDELWRPFRPRERGAGTWRFRRWHLHHHRRWRHDARGAGAF